ncbi:MAG: NAD(+) kinase [Gammaproteobacteria bacterium]|nr:NAD(+) kinase [Gammaproteobacteria bacterium]
MPPGFTRIGLIGKVEDARVADSMAALARQLLERGCSVSTEAAGGAELLPEVVRRCRPGTLAEAVDLIVAVGGDGTMLYAAQLAIGRDIPLLGVNRGRLGFLTDVSPDHMRDSLDALLNGRCTADRRRLLAARLTRADHAATGCRALNDIVVRRDEGGRMIELETWIDGRFVNTHGGDGLVIASSTGSTAYALSCGGPIVHPSLDTLVIAPISPHTLSDRPLVVGADSRVEVRLVSRSATHAQVTGDGLPLGALDDGVALAVTLSAESVTLLHPPGYDYYRLLRSKLHWGRSARNAADP